MTEADLVGGDLDGSMGRNILAIQFLILRKFLLHRPPQIPLSTKTAFKELKSF
jgi:hypothetical protein